MQTTFDTNGIGLLISGAWVAKEHCGISHKTLD